MRNIAAITLLISMGFIIYFFVREQFNGVVLSHNENIFLSVLYLAVGICLLILAAINFSDKKKK
ncbi:MAG: hypothetical protein M3R50_12010 [Bacteroidota bacterium]|nr:hypothetical protein [Bacteroidota bacterium]